MTDMNLTTLWQTVLAAMQLDLSETVFKSVLSPTTLLKKEGQLLEIACPNKFIKDRLEERYYGQIKKVLDRVTNERNELVFVVGSRETAKENPVPLEPGPLFQAPEKAENRETSRGSGLFPHYTLANFVVGTGNNLAFAVAQGIIKNPGKIHNPFFLYAEVGLGKTHLVQAIGNELIKANSHLRALYCTSEDFTNELIQAVQSKKTALFKNKFRTTDLLIIDDIQFIAGKDSIQEEFFHPFNALHQQQKQIVVTSDRPPKEIQRLEERLASRFSSGMIADIQRPDYSTRVAILRNKRDQFNFNVPDEVLNLIAEYVTANIRELEGALKQVVTVALTDQVPVSTSTVQAVLAKNHARSSSQPVTPDRILPVVATYYHIRPEDLLGKSRRADFVLPRQLSMYLIKTLSDLSLMQIGQRLGGRDHTTIIHGLKKMEKLIERSGKIKQDLINIRQSLNVAS